MNTNLDFAEQVQLVSGFVPISLDAGANAGDWVSLKNYERCTIIFFAAAGTAGDDPTITVQQATAVAGTAAKDLTAITKVYTKQGTLTSVGTNTVVTQTAAATYTDATSAEVQKIWQIDIRSADLDVDGGFDCIQASVNDVGTNGQVGCLMYALWGARYGKDALPSAIVD